MAMSGGGGGRGGLNSEINVTPLVDVMLVLLIVFMVTAPMLTTGVDLELPQAEATVLPEDDDAKLILSIDAEAKVYLGGTELEWPDLEDKLATNEKLKLDRELYIEADTTVPYGRVVQAMALARKAGVTKLMMLTDPLETLE